MNHAAVATFSEVTDKERTRILSYSSSINSSGLECRHRRRISERFSTGYKPSFRTNCIVVRSNTSHQSLKCLSLVITSKPALQRGLSTLEITGELAPLCVGAEDTCSRYSSGFQIAQAAVVTHRTTPAGRGK